MTAPNTTAQTVTPSRAAPRARAPAEKLSEVITIPMTTKMPVRLTTLKWSSCVNIKTATSRMAAHAEIRLQYWVCCVKIQLGLRIEWMSALQLAACI